jgi:hypothetical protein
VKELTRSEEIICCHVYNGNSNTGFNIRNKVKEVTRSEGIIFCHVYIGNSRSAFMFRIILIPCIWWSSVLGM